MADEQSTFTVNSIELATELTIAWLNNPNVRPSTDETLTFLRSMRGEIDGMAAAPDAPVADTTPVYIPAVPVRSSVKPDYLISLIDGRKLKSLKRHLSSHGITPAEYRQRYGLKPDYPMVAASYSAERRAVALKLGLGEKGRRARTSAAPEPVVAPAPVQAPAAAKPVRRAASANLAAMPAKPARRAASPKATVAPAKAAPVPSEVEAVAAPAPKPAKRGRPAKAAPAPEPSPAKRGRAKKAPAKS